MAQVTRRDRVTGPSEDIFDENEGVSTTASFATALDIDARPLSESVVVIHNSGAGDLDYLVLGNARHPDDIVFPTGTNDDDKGWVTLPNGTGSIATGGTIVAQTFSNPWSRVVIRIKHTTSTTTANVYHRGDTK